MYLLFLDESGTHDQSPTFILAGLAIHEQDAWYLQNSVEKLLLKMLPKGSDPALFELHANEIKSPRHTATRKKKASEWAFLPFKLRLQILTATYKTLARYKPRDPTYPIALFGAAVDARYQDREARAYEEVLHRFDEMLTRHGHATGLHQRGLVIHDERVIEKSVQAWTDQWRHAAGRIGKLTHLADVPLFADSRASRLIQLADFVAWAMWRYYGLPKSDGRWINPLWGTFDFDKGVMHGLVHVVKGFRSGACSCPACESRKGSGPERTLITK